MFESFRFGEVDYWDVLKEKIRFLQDKIITDYQQSPQKPAVDTSIFYAHESQRIYSDFEVVEKQSV